MEKERPNALEMEEKAHAPRKTQAQTTRRQAVTRLTLQPLAFYHKNLNTRSSKFF